MRVQGTALHTCIVLPLCSAYAHGAHGGGSGDPTWQDCVQRCGQAISDDVLGPSPLHSHNPTPELPNWENVNMGTWCGVMHACIPTTPCVSPPTTWLPPP
jgi:hypothetical protein